MHRCGISWVLLIAWTVVGRAELACAEDAPAPLSAATSSSTKDVALTSQPAHPGKVGIDDADLAARRAIEQNVVKLLVTQRRPDFFRPWTKASPANTSGTGAVLPDGRILTNAHVVMYASQIFVQLRQGGDQLAAKVKAIAPGIDLAVVELIDKSVLHAPGLPLATALPQPKSSVSAYGYPTGGDDLSVTDGIVSRIEYTGFNYGVYGVRIQVDAALNPGNSGGPAVQNGEITGLVFSKIEKADNIGYLIPAEEIRRFLDDVADGSYDGTPQIFDEIQTAENQALRDWLNLDADVTGVVISKPYRDDPEYPIKRWDVITHIGPHAIDNQGYVDVRPGLRLRYHYFVPYLAREGKVELTIRRDGAAMTVQTPVTSEPARLVPMLKEGYPEYFIYGPLVFTVATQEYIAALGARGLSLLAAYESPLLKRLGDKPAEPGEQLVLIATRSFPHPTTKGYDNRTLGVVEKINGTPVKNLRHLAELLRGNSEQFLLMDLGGRGESFIFRTTEIAAATEEILESEGVRYQASESLRDVWEE